MHVMVSFATLLLIKTTSVKIGSVVHERCHVETWGDAISLFCVVYKVFEQLMPGLNQ